MVERQRVLGELLLWRLHHVHRAVADEGQARGQGGELECGRHSGLENDLGWCSRGFAVLDANDFVCVVCRTEVTVARLQKRESKR